MIMELRNLLSMSNLGPVEKSKSKVFLAIGIIAAMDTGMLTFWIMPSSRNPATSQRMFRIMTYYIVTVQAVFFVFLTYSTYKLIMKLKNIEQSNKQVNFAQEKKNVLLTVITFDIIYSIRIILGYWLIPQLYSGYWGQFWAIEGSLISCSLLDLTPLVIVMLLHRSNFKRQATTRLSVHYSSAQNEGSLASLGLAEQLIS